MELKEPILLRNILRKLNGENIWNLLDWDLQTLAEKFGDARLPFRTGHMAKTSVNIIFKIVKILQELHHFLFI